MPWHREGNGGMPPDPLGGLETTVFLDPPL